jgi:DnaK suppressor protein
MGIQKSGNTMDKNQLIAFRQQLLSLRQELQTSEEISEEARQPVALDQSMVGRLSRIDAMQGVQMAQEASRRRQQQLVRIVGALARIDADLSAEISAGNRTNNEYGYCSLCDEDISIGRLNIDPTYVLCIGCADKPVQ